MIWLVLGLGNIGDRYSGSRHNLGFAVLNEVAARLKASPRPSGDHGLTADVIVAGRTVTLAWPTTLMNRSGWAAAELTERLQIAPAELLVVVDDYNLPLGRLRFRAGGSDGGHNGLTSVIECLGTDQFPRLRLGIGPVPEATDVVEYVLGRFGSSEQEAVSAMVSTAVEAVLFAIDHRLEEAMSKYNSSPALPDVS